MIFLIYLNNRFLISHTASFPVFCYLFSAEFPAKE